MYFGKVSKNEVQNLVMKSGIDDTNELVAAFGVQRFKLGNNFLNENKMIVKNLAHITNSLAEAGFLNYIPTGRGEPGFEGRRQKIRLQDLFVCRLSFPNNP